MNGGIILPEFDPFVISFGGFGVRWYALAYIAGLLGGYWVLRREARRQPHAPMTPEAVDSLLNHVLLGVILGGRLGYVIFYNPSFFLANPLEIIKVWQGGMSFHGGLLGVTFAMWLFARRWRIPVLAVSDRVAMVIPLGLFLGRLSNFINAELYGRVTDLPWGMVFPRSDGLPRHPSQLYEAGLEGLVLLVEDSSQLRRNFRDMLVEMGFTVIEATSTDEALSLVNQIEDIALILSDIRLEGPETGLDLLQKVNPALPCILMTSLPYSDPLHRQALALAPVLRKPFTQAQLTALIRNEAA